MHDNLAEQILEHQFVHLRAQSSYSMLASALKVNRLAELAAKYKMPAVAMTDINNLFGSLEFSLEATKKGVQPIHGAILNLCYQELDGVPQFGEILVLAKDQTGYQNLLTLVSIPYLKNDRKFKEHITWQDLTAHQQGLIILSGYTEGPIGIELAKNNNETAEANTQKFLNIFQDRFYFEIMRHGLQLERKIENSYLQLAHKLEIPLVATNKILFENIEMHEAHDVLLCIAAGVVKDNTNRPRVSNQCYFKSPAEMMTLFEDIPSAITNAGYIARRCFVKAEVHDPMLPNYATENLSEEEYLRQLAFDGLNKRLQHKFPQESLTPEQEAEKQKYFDRLNYELDVICQMKFPGYFLIVSDFIRWSKEQGIYVGPGRGSGAGSIVAWSLLITDLDPLHFGLLFERFLNPERVSMPDFDIDFCQERREEVINYVRQKYSDERVGQIITFGKLQAKAVIKDVSRVLGLKYEYADYLTELVPFNAVNPVTLDQAINEVAELRQAYAGKGLYNLPENKELIKQVLDTALVLEGLHRHCSVHAAGIVISGKNLLEVVPLYKDPHGEMSIIQYSMKYAELAGLVKFDFLGLQTLTVLSKCLSLLHSQGIPLELEKISFKDDKTYQMLAAGNSIGVFQFESVGMRDTLRKLRPDRIEDLMALGALYRPGPMDNIPTYIACKHGRQQPDYLHPMLKPLLQETYGVIVYQEQVLEIAKVLGGYSLGAADLLRRAMGKKVKAEMDAQEKLFVEGAVKNKISAEQASNIFASVAKFAGYGFNRAHAASYAVISYYTAFLKANYPIEFFIACLNLDIRDQDQINVFLHEAKEQNIKIAPPNINNSEGLFTLGLDNEGNKSINFGLGAIKNVTVNFGDEAAKERKAKGRFKSIIDFVERMPPKLITKRSLECTIKAGCFDELHPNRRQLFESIPALLALSQRYHQEKSLQQFTLFTSTSSSDVLVNIEDYDNQTKAYLELEVLGFFITLHPITPMLDICAQQNIKTIADIKNNLPFGSNQVKFAGVILRKDARMSARGRFITMHLSDPTGMIEATIFSEEVLRQYAHLINVKSAVIVTCEAFRDEGSIKLTASKFAALDNIVQDSFKTMKIKVASKDELNEVIALLNSRQDPAQEEMTISLQVPATEPFFADINFKSKHKFTPADLDFLNKFLIKN